MSGASGTELLASALLYASIGWYVLPLHSMHRGRCTCREGESCSKSPAKHPRTKHGILDATTDEATIRAWWRRWPDANIGLAMRKSGLIGIDVDSHKSEENGHETLGRLEAEHGPLRATLEAITPGGICGGRHLISKHPGCPIVSDRGVLGPGLDVRDDAYVVASPSIHVNGGRYRWREGHEPGSIEPADLRDWLVEKLTPKQENAGPSPTEDTDTPIHRILRLLPDARPEGRGWKSRCPAHNDHNPSLSIDEAADGRVLLKCFAGCTNEAVTEAIGLKMRDLFPRLTVVRGNGRQPQGDDAEQDAMATMVGAPFTDLGNAERLQALFGDRIRLCLERGWFVWDGCMWEQDPGPFVQALAAQAARRTLEIAAGVEDEEKRKAVARHALKFESAQRIAAAEKLARGIPELQVHANALDTDPWLLNTPSGLVELRTGALRPHDPKQLCTKLTGAPFVPGADCPRWESFLLEVFKENVEIVLFMQRAIGMALAGSTSEQVLFFLWGGGANGKSVLLETLRFVLGTYARTAPMALWLSDKGERANTATPDLVALQGARFVTSIESNAERRLNEGLVKAVTGGDRLSARELFGRSFEFDFVGKVFCASNHRPVIRGTDDGIWRRFLLVPFTQTFTDPKDPRNIQPGEKDRDLPAKLQAESSGILRWAVDGCLAWQRHGLCPPEEVRGASQEYREEQDRLGAWLAERCIRDPNVTALSAELYNDFTAWAQANGEDAMTSKAFGMALAERGFACHRTNAARLRKGLALVDGSAQLAIGGVVP